MAALNRRINGRINGHTSVTLITCFIIQWEKLHLVIHERCQWDLGTAGSVQVQSRVFPFFFSSWSRQKCICLPHPACVLFFFLKIGNKRNGLRLCCSDSSWEIRSFFLISFTRDCIIMMKSQINCAHVHCRAQLSDSLFYGRLNNSGQPDASRV